MRRSSKFSAMLVAVMMALSLGVAGPGADIAVAKAKTVYVYIAPYSGTKYHKTKNCRTLKRARSVKKLTYTKAKSQGYGACKVCRPKK